MTTTNDTPPLAILDALHADPTSRCDEFPRCCYRDTCVDCGDAIDWTDDTRDAHCPPCRAQAIYEDGDHDAYDRVNDR